MMQRKPLLMACLSLSMAMLGCSAMQSNFQKMAEPESGDRVKIRVVTDASSVRGFPNSTCNNYKNRQVGMIMGDALTDKGYRGRSLGMPQAKHFSEKDSAEFYAQANQPLTISFYWKEGNRYCVIPASFTPEKNKNYQVNAVYENEKCGFIVHEVHKKGFKKYPAAIACRVD